MFLDMAGSNFTLRSAIKKNQNEIVDKKIEKWNYNHYYNDYWYSLDNDEKVLIFIKLFWFMQKKKMIISMSLIVVILIYCMTVKFNFIYGHHI